MCEVTVRLRFENPRQHGIVRTLDRTRGVRVSVLHGRVTKTSSRIEVELRGPRRAVFDTLRMCRRNGLQIEPMTP